MHRTGAKFTSRAGLTAFAHFMAQPGIWRIPKADVLGRKLLERINARALQMAPGDRRQETLNALACSVFVLFRCTLPEGSETARASTVRCAAVCDFWPDYSSRLPGRRFQSDGYQRCAEGCACTELAERLSKRGQRAVGQADSQLFSLRPTDTAKSAPKHARTSRLMRKCRSNADLGNLFGLKGANRMTLNLHSTIFLLLLN